MGEWGGVDTPYTVLTTRAPAVLKMSLFVFLTNLEPEGFAFPFQIKSTLHHPEKKTCACNFSS